MLRDAPPAPARCYEHFSLWAGLLYRRWANADPARHVNTAAGDKTTVDVGALRPLVAELLPAVRRRRDAAAAAASTAALAAAGDEAADSAADTAEALLDN